MSLNCASCTKSRTLDSTGNAPYVREPPYKVASKQDSNTIGSQEFETGRTAVSWQPDASHYDLYTVIGNGSFDCVTISVAKHNPSGKNVAVKKINVENSPVDCSVLQSEIILCKQLNHENIIRYYSTFVHGNEIWIIMPLMAYGSARDILHAYFKTGLPELAATYILRDVLTALDYLHCRGIIHRSLRASHILIAADGHICLSGFRSAYHMVYHGKKWNQVHQYPDHSVASLQWLSPEILQQNLSGYDTKSDMYSFGITSWELVNGYPPFEDMPVTQMMYEKISGTKPVLPDITTIAELIGEEEHIEEANEDDTRMDIVKIAKQRKFSPHFHNLINTCLEINPDSRPSAGGLLTDSLFKHLKKRTTEALPALLQPLSPLRLGDMTKLPKAEDTVVDSVIESMDHVDLTGDWEF